MSTLGSRGQSVEREVRRLRGGGPVLGAPISGLTGPSRRAIPSGQQQTVLGRGGRSSWPQCLLRYHSGKIQCFPLPSGSEPWATWMHVSACDFLGWRLCRGWTSSCPDPLPPSSLGSYPHHPIPPDSRCLNRESVRLRTCLRLPHTLCIVRLG